jgi:membrane protein required for colicin V production
VVILVYIIGRIIEKFVDILALGFVNKLFGAVFGVLKAAFILSLLILIINSFDTNKTVITEKLRQGSMLYNPIESLVPAIIPSLNLEELDENIDAVVPDNLREI